MTIDHALDLLDHGDTALAVFTRGPHLEIHADGTGTSGNWKMRQTFQPDKLIIYLRPPDRIPPRADIYLATFVDTVPSTEGGRLVVQFRDARLVGTTRRNWYDFAQTGPGPVRYLSKT